MQTQNFLDRYRQGERDFARIDLSGANLSGADLRNINLSGANLTSANLSWASLDRSNLAEACLDRADLHNSILSNVNFNRANLSRANLGKADLRLASLKEANLNWVDAASADFSEAELYKALLDRINLTQAQLNKTILIDAQLMEANLCGASLIGANLTDANLIQAQLERANLSGAILVSTNLTEANLQSAYLRSANLRDADLYRAILTNADLSEANCDRADLSRANLTGAYAIRTNFSGADLMRAVLQDVYLLRSDLTQANLRGADLQRADLSGSYLKDTILSEANLRDASFLESNLIRTKLDGAKLTGCCIHNWHLEEVDLSSVNCRYIFTGFNRISNSPCDRYPATGELPFGKLSEEKNTDRATIKVEFVEVPNWEVFVFTLAQIEQECPDLKLKIESYQAKVGQYLFHLSANHRANEQRLRRRILQLYPKMSQRVLENRQIILESLKILEPGNIKTESILQGQKSSPPPTIILDAEEQVYQRTIYQIQRIIMSQPPDRFVTSVQRLLKFLKQQNISTEEIQQTIICQVILKRAAQEEGFKKQLMVWEDTASRAARASKVGQSMRAAIALILAENSQFTIHKYK
ncbi:pentapeptide repeat-containing protein [Limnofasciculus baicalensis]|uniref:Pentapeptide repeat-containing protein n=1 Tax=Limnofasciculus baicalensis BBK-W-15 TaxID=2699891 RepID=A0AAE3GWI8_9CYAN|nr:pentapeptide repeat-containing protein [Limnofasciculus baicalensis]MCP2732005.1 pentapeptide repeat-containing protein [Limnofasciculus baicalensis BBK-W-15]